jgi:hypothetical protein
MDSVLFRFPEDGLTDNQSALEVDVHFNLASPVFCSVSVGGVGFGPATGASTAMLPGDRLIAGAGGARARVDIIPTKSRVPLIEKFITAPLG